jgi:hypothetical protein
MGNPTLNDGCIRSCRLDGSDVSTVVPIGKVHTPKQLAVDESGPEPMIYFCDREGMRVMRCCVDGTRIEVLFESGDMSNLEHMADKTRWCVGVAVAPRHRKVYFTLKGPSKGRAGRLCRMGIDIPAGETSRNRSDVQCVFDGLPEPVDIEVDEQGDWLYWTDRGELPLGNSLNRVRFEKIDQLVQVYDRPELKVAKRGDYEILARNLHEAVGLKLDSIHRYVYITDLGGTVYRFHMDRGEEEEVSGMCRIYDCQGNGAFTGIAILSDQEGSNS